MEDDKRKKLAAKRRHIAIERFEDAKEKIRKRDKDYHD